MVNDNTAKNAIDSHLANITEQGDKQKEIIAPEYLSSSNKKNITINILKRDINIVDSYLVRSGKEMREVLNGIRKEHTSEECLPLKRSNFVMVNEWMGHNLAYDLGLFIDHTKDVDLDDDNNIFKNTFYFLASLIYRLYKKTYQ